MNRLCFFALLVLGFSARRMVASPVTYAISVDTSSLQGTTGSLDFNFDPGPLGSQAAIVQLHALGGGGIPGAAMSEGSVSGTLPGTVTLQNSTGYNDYFETFTFGPSLLFDASFLGPALDAPNGTSLSGSTFAFSFFSDPGGTMPALTSDVVNGYAVTVDVNLDGSTTVTNFTRGTVTTPSSTAMTPEPGTWMMVGTGVLGGVWSARRRRVLPRKC